MSSHDPPPDPAWNLAIAINDVIEAADPAISDYAALGALVAVAIVRVSKRYDLRRDQD